MMEQANYPRDRLEPDRMQADNPLSIAVASEVISNSSASKTNVREEGLTVLSEGVNPVADIVFIHGIRGHPRKTWTYGLNPGKSKTKISKIFHGKKKSLDARGLDSRQDSPYWPEDFLSKDFENACIMTYGYDSHVSHFFKGPANQNNINAHGRSLLNALEFYRRQDPKRRLIFVVHSLGGLILKEALRRSRRSSDENQDLRNVYQSLHSIVFFGTPHRGSSYAEVGITAQKIAKAIGFDANDSLLRNLRPDGEHLELLREEFASMLDERTFKVYSFQEGQGLKGTHSLARKIVDDASSSLDHPMERKDFINSNHMMMCRFKSPDDDGYIKVKGVISKYLAEIQEIKLQEQKRIDRDQIKLLNDCLKSLKTVAMHERQDEIEVAHRHTFEWAFSDPKAGFYDWLKGDGGLFWIRGKPASGKSTLMKYILEDGRTLETLHDKYGRNSVTMPGFFFHNRGANLTQKSLDGLLRSILFRILSDLPELIEHVAEVYRNARDMQGSCSWQLAESKKALNLIIQQTKISGCIMLFIDALDEFVGKDIEIARFLKDLLRHPGQQGLRIRICASSRPHNVFYDMLGEFPSLAIHDWTRRDISIYTFDRLGECRREGLEVLHEEITSRAQGVFLWVKLVIEELSEPLFNGEPIPLLVARLSDLPDDLFAFYRLLLKKLPQEKRPVTQKMLELVLCSHNRIRLITFTAAVSLLGHGIPNVDSLQQGPFDILRGCEEVVRQVRSSSGGLLEVVQSHEALEAEIPEWLYAPLERMEFDFTRQYVRLLHQTAKEFINDPLNSDLMSGNSPIQNAVAGHLQLMELYIYIAKLGKPSLWTTFGQLPDCRILKLCPPKYGIVDTDVIPSFYLNARSAENLSGLPNLELVTAFENTLCDYCGQHWPVDYLKREANNGEDILPYSVLTTPLAFAIMAGLYCYAEEVLFGQHVMHDKEQLGSLLYSAYVGGSFKFIRGRFYISTDFGPRKQHFISLLLENGANPNRTIPFHYIAFPKQVGSAEPGSVITDEEVADTDTDSSLDSSSRSLVYSEVNSDTVTRPNRVLVGGNMEMSILHFALGLKALYTDWTEESCAFLEAIRVLLRHGADVNEKHLRTSWLGYVGYSFVTPESQSALHYLVFRSSPRSNLFKNYLSGPTLSRLVKEFLEHGADPNAMDSNGLSVLECALPTCPYDVVELMLGKGAKITPRLVSESGIPRRSDDVDIVQGEPGGNDDYELLGPHLRECIIVYDRPYDRPVVNTSYMPAGDILDEVRWRRPECYTDEARELARPHNPHWAKLEDTEKEVAEMSLASRFRALIGLS